VRNRITRIPYTVSNVIEVWKSDLFDVKDYDKYKYNFRFLSVIDVFSEYLHLIPIRTKNGSSVISAFRSISDEFRRRRPIFVRTDKGKEFLNKQFQVCRNHDLKCAVAERVHLTTPDRLYKYFKH